MKNGIFLLRSTKSPVYIYIENLCSVQKNTSVKSVYVYHLYYTVSFMASVIAPLEVSMQFIFLAQGG